MVNNATNFNKTNISPELAENNTTKKETMTYYVRNPGPGVGQAHKCTRLYYVHLTISSPHIILGGFPQALQFPQPKNLTTMIKLKYC